MARKATKNVRHPRTPKTPKIPKVVTTPTNTKLTPDQRLAKVLATKDLHLTTTYPHYVPGSVRLATREETTSHFKKFVALVNCDCGNTRLISTSDVFQVHQCSKCKSGVDKKVNALKAKLATAEAKAATLPNTAAA